MEARFWMRDTSKTILVAGPHYIRVLGRWQSVIHRLGAWLQDFAYAHSPEVEVEPAPEQWTYTSGSG